MYMYFILEHINEVFGYAKLCHLSNLILAIYVFMHCYLQIYVLLILNDLTSSLKNIKG
jgi:hypothetical protein